MLVGTHGQGGWVGVGYPYPDILKSTRLLTLAQTSPKRDNFEVSRAPPQKSRIIFCIFFA